MVKFQRVLLELQAAEDGEDGQNPGRDAGEPSEWQVEAGKSKGKLMSCG